MPRHMEIAPAVDARGSNGDVRRQSLPGSASVIAQIEAVTGAGPGILRRQRPLKRDALGVIEREREGALYGSAERQARSCPGGSSVGRAPERERLSSAGEDSSRIGRRDGNPMYVGGDRWQRYLLPCARGERMRSLYTHGLRGG